MANDTRLPSNPGLGYVSKVSPDQMVERAMIQGTKYVDAFPSTVEGGYSPMNKPEGYTLSSQLVHQFGGRRTGATQA